MKRLLTMGALLLAGPVAAPAQTESPQVGDPGPRVQRRRR